MDGCPMAPVQVTEPSGKIPVLSLEDLQNRCSDHAAVFQNFSLQTGPSPFPWSSNFPFAFRHSVVIPSLPGKGELTKLKTAPPPPPPNFETLISVNSFS